MNLFSPLIKELKGKKIAVTTLSQGLLKLERHMPHSEQATGREDYLVPDSLFPEPFGFLDVWCMK